MGHNFQSTDTKHTSNPRINSQGLGSISLIHSDLHRLLECILMVDKGDEEQDKDDNKEMNGKNKTYKRGEIDKTFVDFGCKYRLIVKYKASEADRVDGGSAANDGPGPGSSPDFSSGSHATILMHIAVIGWEETVKEQATERLVTIFGNDNVFLDELSSSISKNNSSANSKMQPIGTHSAFRVAKGYSICVRVHVDDTSTTSLERETICSHLSNIRMTLLGSKLQDAFVSLANRNVEQQSKDIIKEPIFKIPIQRSPLVHTINGDNTNINHTNNKGQSQCQPSILVSCKSDRITVVTPFIFRNDKEVDCALAKLFLQQFEAAQRKSMKERHGKNVPICDYRRSSDPPLEVKRDQGIAEAETESESEAATRTAPTTEQLLVHHAGFLSHHAGFLSLTFLEHHVDTESKRAKAVSNVLMFVDYVDYHIKCSKSNMLSRMRTKKDALMRDLFEE